VLERDDREVSSSGPAADENPELDSGLTAGENEWCGAP
jgi:hypothetical protein